MNDILKNGWLFFMSKNDIRVVLSDGRVSGLLNVETDGTPSDSEHCVL
jgi:hypothetical protein